MTQESLLILPYCIDGVTFGIPVQRVERVVSVVEITPVPDMPSTVLGLINVHGDVVPVLSMRRKLGFTDRAIDLTDTLIIVRQDDWRRALLVDSVSEVRECSAHPGNGAGDVAASSTGLASVHISDDGLMQIQDLALLLAGEIRTTAAQQQMAATL